MNHKGDIINSSIVMILQEYIDILISHEKELAINDNHDVKYRVKNFKCVINKITRFNRNNKLGTFPLNKVLNDILGYRLIITSTLPIKELKLNIQETVETLPTAMKNKITVLNSSKNQYKAVHVYFKLSNRTYPIELQIWRAKDREQNRDSHLAYKQDYMKWHVRETELIHQYG
ncbi:hypothetical protein [Staphylococcus pettenkoferi]|nr:hypothetical protein [Staphylococcus pettenkoferi]MCY1569867.1 hypothetical protein [Staphylococcus pettenkoferi]MCY1575426.1 hypothetical protein [Staphylococcus pettenkoferi]MCY1618166.1 hypothetical protein [Staphylococcus pettenkoferi]